MKFNQFQLVQLGGDLHAKHISKLDLGYFSQLGIKRYL